MGIEHGATFGDYIHYNYANYKNYGLARRIDEETERKGYKANFNDLISSHYNKILNAASQNANRAYCKKLEDLLNFFAGVGSGNNVDITEVQAEQIQQLIYQKMQESWDIASDGIDFEHGKVNLQKISNVKQIKNTARSHAGSTTGGKQTGFNYTQLMKRAELVKQQAEQLLAQGTSTGGRGKDLKELTTKLEKIQANFEVEFKASGSGLRIAAGTTLWQSAKTFQDMIRELAKECIFRTATVLCEGELAETMVSAAVAVLDGGLKDFSKDMYGEFSRIVSVLNGTATSRSSNTIFASKINARLLGGWDKEVMQGSSYQSFTATGSEDLVGWKTVATQNKADVTMNIGNASVKAYNLQGDYSTKVGISLVSKTSLLNIILQAPLFANHYLNVTGYNETHSATDSLVIEANQALKKLIFLSAISGTIGKDDGKFADYFIMKDKASGRFTVYAIMDLYDRIINNLNFVSVSLGKGELDLNQTWNNDWIGDKVKREYDTAKATTRILRLTKQLHQNINVHLSPAALT